MSEGLKELGTKAFQERDFERAIELYTRAIEQEDRANNHVLFSNRSAAKVRLTSNRGFLMNRMEAFFEWRPVDEKAERFERARGSGIGLGIYAITEIEWTCSCFCRFVRLCAWSIQDCEWFKSRELLRVTARVLNRAKRAREFCWLLR